MSARRLKNRQSNITIRADRIPPSWCGLPARRLRVAYRQPIPRPTNVAWASSPPVSKGRTGGREARATVLCIFFLTLTTQAGDVLTLKNGRTADCRILSFSPAAVKILWQEKEERDIPVADIDFITFAPLHWRLKDTEAPIGTSLVA